MRRIALIAAVVLGASALAACQSQGVGSATPQRCVPAGNCGVTVKKFPIVPAFKVKGDAKAGKPIFLTNCGGCHVLAAAGTVGTTGPNLDTLTPKVDYRAATAQVTNGGGPMPAFGKAPYNFSTKQIADVSAYVVTSIGGTVP